MIKDLKKEEMTTLYACYGELINGPATHLWSICVENYTRLEDAIKKADEAEAKKGKVDLVVMNLQNSVNFPAKGTVMLTLKKHELLMFQI